MANKRVFCAGLATETNTFSPIPTTFEDFQNFVYYPAGLHPFDGPTMFSAPLWVARTRQHALGWQVIEGLCAAALPGGRTTRETYHRLKAELLDDLSKALPVDAVILGLHGAMMAVGCDDCEGDLLTEVRALCGPDVFVAAALDPHCHLSDAMVSNADLLLAFKKYPHTDVMDRANELVALTDRALRGEISPVMAAFDCRMIAMFYTDLEPVIALLDHMQATEQQQDVLSISLIHGFASGDCADLGTKVLVVTDADALRAAQLADLFGAEVQALRGRSEQLRETIDETLARVARAGSRPVIIADGADNPGGGAPGDSTHMIHALLEAGIDNIAAGPIWDPQMVSMMMAWGEGAEINARIGGKTSPLSGPALDLKVRIRKIIPSASQRFADADWPLGDVLAVSCGHTDLVLCSIRNQCFSTSVFTDCEIDLLQKSAIVVKSNQHFYESFSQLGGEVIYLSAPGVNVIAPQHTPYRTLRRQLWPMHVQV